MSAQKPPRFYVAPEETALQAGTEAKLPASAARHAASVLRLRAGEPVILFDGRGGEFAGTIARIDKRGVSVAVDAHDPVERESRLGITLVQAVLATDAMDWTVRKAVELGVARIAPIRTQRTQGSGAERSERRAAHWRQIAIAACEQCGRNRVPTIDALRELPEALALHDDAPRLLLSPEASVPLARWLARTVPKALIIGPEGGFTADERELVLRAGVDEAHLGVRILRAETAAIAALAVTEAIGG